MEEIEDETTKKESESSSGVTLDYQDYIDQIEKLKAGTVSKESYEKLKNENKKLIETLTNGGSYEGGKQAITPEEREKRIAELRKALYGREQGNLLNLDYITKTLELREALISKGEKDPFLPFGHDVIPTDADIESANRTARILKECVEYAQGDSSVFTNELQRRTLDVKIPARKQN